MMSASAISQRSETTMYTLLRYDFSIISKILDERRIQPMSSIKLKEREDKMDISCHNPDGETKLHSSVLECRKGTQLVVLKHLLRLCSIL